WSALFDISLGNIKGSQIFEGYVDAPLLEVDGDVLPKVRKLETDACRVREPLTPRILVAQYGQHHLPYRSGRILAVVEELAIGLESLLALVDAVGFDQPQERVRWDFEAVDGMAESDK